MRTGSGGGGGGSSTPRHKNAELGSYNLKNKVPQSGRICSPEEIVMLKKIFGVLFLLGLLVLVFRVSTDQKMRNSRSHELGVVNYRPPTNLMHSMTDEELFRHALRVSRLRNSGGRPKIAFMFLTAYRMHLTPLWDAYFEGHKGLYSVYIHSEEGDYAVKSAFYKRKIPSKASEENTFTTIDATRRLLANALLDLSNQRFVLLSHSCIPLYNFTFTYDYLMNSKHSFVEAFDEPGPGARDRYNSKLAPELRLSQWRKGTPWLEADRMLAVVAVGDAELYAKFDGLRDEMWHQQEHFFPSMLTVKAAHLIANRSLTWELWKNGGSGPETFGKEQTTMTLLEGIKRERKCLYNGEPSTVCFLFARRFSSSALWPLLRLAPALGFPLSASGINWYDG